MRVKLQRDIEKKTRVLSLSTWVEERFRLSVKSIECRDADLAKEVIEGDLEIDHLEVDLEEECLKILALHQPVADNLRYIVAILKMNNDLERIGDLRNESRELAGCGERNRRWKQVPKPGKAEDERGFAG
jgi:phosphate transport system protein